MDSTDKSAEPGVHAYRAQSLEILEVLNPMDDLTFLVLTAAVFGLLFALVRGLEKLQAGVGDE